MVDRGDKLSGTLSRMTSVLLNRTKLDVVLPLVATLAKETVPGADSVSVTLVQDGHMVTPASSDQTAPRIDEVQYDSGQGPCVDAATTGAEVHVDNLAQEARWPDVQREAAALGISSVLSLPLTIDGGPLGGLNCYSRRHGGLEPAEVDQMRRFAEQATIMLANAQAFAESEQRNEQLKEALASRDIIGQAKGILMERENITADQAFDMLRRASQRSNVKLRDLAEQLARIHGDGPREPATTAEAEEGR